MHRAAVGGGPGNGAVDADDGPAQLGGVAPDALHEEEVHGVAGVRRREQEHLVQLVAGSDLVGVDVGSEACAVGGAGVVEVHGPHRDAHRRIERVERRDHALHVRVGGRTGGGEWLAGPVRGIGDDVEIDVEIAALGQGSQHDRHVVGVGARGARGAARVADALIGVVVDGELPVPGRYPGVHRRRGVGDGERPRAGSAAAVVGVVRARLDAAVRGGRVALGVVVVRFATVGKVQHAGHR